MSTVGTGELTYECGVKATAPGEFEWVFAGHKATLYDTNKNPIGKYYGGPTLESNDSSKISGKQLAVSPGASGSIPLQLVQASPATGDGALTGVTYVQRLNTVGGVAPADVCNAAALGTKRQVNYQADYNFYKADR